MSILRKNKDSSLINRLVQLKMAKNETPDYYSFIGGGGKKGEEPIEPEKEKGETFEERFKHRFKDPKCLPPTQQ